MNAYRLAALALCGAAGIQCAGAAEHRVVIEGMAFTPRVVKARPGDTITWVNKDLFDHNVTAAAAGIRSGDFKPGQTWRFTVRAGTSIDYLCTLHPTMTGRIQVEAPLPKLTMAGGR
jgi:plastocyanin